MKLITLNSLTLWKSLPWKKINQRIFTLQERIYIFAQQCNKNNVCKIQNYILNSSDAKILAIQEICKNVSKYYMYYHKEKYSIKDVDKLHLYNYLFTNQTYLQKEPLIITHVKQYLIYLCLKPEWEARLEPTYKFNIKNRSECYFIYKLSNFFANSCSFKSNKKLLYSLSQNTINKYIDINNFVSKVQSLPFICYYIKCWLNQQHIPEYSNLKYCNKNDKSIQIIINCLDKLIYNIVYNGTEWYTINILHYSIKANNIFKNLHFIYNNHTILETYFKNHNVFKSPLKVVESIYKLAKFYHFNSSYSYIYEKQKITNNFGTFAIAQKYNITCLKHDKWILRIQVLVYQHFILCMKNLLYHYNLFGKLKPNTFLNSSIALQKINDMIIDFYKSYYPLVNSNNISLLLEALNKVLLLWIKKTKNKISLLYNNNQYLTKQILNIV